MFLKSVGQVKTERCAGVCQPLGTRVQGFFHGGGFGQIGAVHGPFQSTFWGKLPLLTAFRGPEALKVHFRCIYDGLLIRRFQSRVPSGPKKILGGSMNSKGSYDRLFGFKEDAAPSCGVKQGPTTDGETSFLTLNFALKAPGTRALPSLHPWKEHSFLRRRSCGTQKFCDSSIPKTNEDLPP